MTDPSRAMISLIDDQREHHAVAASRKRGVRDSEAVLLCSGPELYISLNGPVLGRQRLLVQALPSGVSAAHGKNLNVNNLLAETGQIIASDTLATKVVEATSFPRSFFDRPPRELPPPLYRKRSTMGRKRLDAIQALASVYVEAHAAVTGAVGVRLPPILPDGRRNDIERAAADTRAALKLAPDDPIPHVVAAVEQAGCVVIQLPQREARFDGFSTWANDCIPVIVTDAGAEGVGDRYRFTVAHELGHLVLHRKAVLELKLAEEEANRFAGAFLLPKRAILEDLRKVSLTPQGLAPLKAKWRVAISALFMRARHLGLADERRAVAFFKDMSRRGWRKREPIDIPLERPIVLRKAYDVLRKKHSADAKNVAPIALSELAELIGFRVA